MGSKFCDAITAWCSEAQHNIADKTRDVAIDIFARAIDESPDVNDNMGGFSVGHFMANWQVGLTPSSGERAGTMTREARLSQLKREITQDWFLRNDSIVLFNTASYAKAVEEGIGWIRTPGYMPVAKAHVYAMSKYGA